MYEPSVGFDDDNVWISNFEQVQIESVLVKAIPNVTLYYSKNSKLFLLNSLLPSCKEPMLLWTPIERALPLKIHSFNHNYFGLDDKLSISIVSEI